MSWVRIGSVLADERWVRDSDGRPNKQTGTTALPGAALGAQLAKSKELGADVVLHTGNLINFPSFRAAYDAHSILEDAGMPYLLTTGNHVRCPRCHCLLFPYGACNSDWR